MKKTKHTKTNNFCVLVLAGGKGTRMKSDTPKPLHKACGLEILAHILRTAQSLRPAAIGVLLGHQYEEARAYIEAHLESWGITVQVVFCRQRQLTGSATAVKDSFKFISKYKDVLVLSGDAPLIRAATLRSFYSAYRRAKASAGVLAVTVPDAFGYGRIIRDARGNFLKITEHNAATEQEREIKEINSGMYIFNAKNLKTILSKIQPKGAKKEYFITDAVELTLARKEKAIVYNAPDYTEALGINSQSQLAEAEAIMYARKNIELMDGGVHIIAPAATYIDSSVEIAPGAEIHPGVWITGATVIDGGAVVEPNCVIKEALIGRGAVIYAGSYIEKSVISARSKVGPFAHLRRGTILKEGAKVGNFSETKNAVIGARSKVNHLSYIGDAELGADVNVGAGTITCNYDGVNKYKTVIHDGAFIGSNTNLVAPVVVGSDALVGAGSTITKDVSAGRLAVARARQVELRKRNKRK